MQLASVFHALGSKSAVALHPVLLLVIKVNFRQTSASRVWTLCMHEDEP